jgi:hypothetical protein
MRVTYVFAMATFLSNISVRDLRRAINLREKIETLQHALASILGAVAGSGSGYATRKISAAGRARIAAAQRARWAKVKGRKGAGGGGRRVMSAAARAKIAAAARKRWARAKASGKRTLAG